MSEEVDPRDAEIERLRQEIRVKDVHITGLNAEISWRIQLLQNKGNMKPTMNDDLKPQGTPRKLTWDGAMFIAELVAMRYRDQFPNGSPEWQAAHTIAGRLSEVDYAWRQYIEKNLDADRDAEKETKAIDHSGSVEMTKNDDNNRDPKQRIAAIRSYSLKPSENPLNEETVFLLGQIDIRDAEITRLKAALRTVAARIDNTVAVGWLGDYRGTLVAFLREVIGDPPGTGSRSE